MADANDQGDESTRILQVATSESLAIMFADVCDSTRMYESAGDSVAYALVERSLGLMRTATQRASGTVIRTMGDGMLCTFPSATAAFAAASELQYAHREGTLRIKIGMHFGPALAGVDGDVYGDSVNLAARISSLARAGETLLTEEVVEKLPQIYRRSTRLLDKSTLKGKKDPVNVYLMVDEGDMQATMVEPAPRAVAGTVTLELRYHDALLRLDESRPKAVLGRDIDCDLVVAGAYASRRHVMVELRRGRFVLTDQSTNGTYVREGSDLKFLKRESADLGTSGVIALGASPDTDNSGIVHFERVSSGGVA